MSSVSPSLNYFFLNLQIVNLFKKPDCKIIFDEVQGRHRHKLIDRNDHSERYPTFFNGEDITGRVELKLNSKTLKHKGIKAELHGIIERYGTINKTKSILNISSDISRPEEIVQEKKVLNFQFQNVKLPYESYKGDYATVKYFVKIIIISTYKNTEYEKEFAVVNPYDSSILKQNDEPIRMQVGMKEKLSLAIYFHHKNYNCRGTLKGFILFNFINISLKFMEVQIVRRESIFGDKKCEPAYVARYELIDGVPIKNERIPIRFFLKSYNLTPTYQNIDNIFCVRYFLNLVIADEEDNRYFKQKEICLYRLYKERKNYYNSNNDSNYNDGEYYNNNDEIFITEPIYEEDYSLDYLPEFGRPKNKRNQQGDDYIFPILPSEDDDFRFNNSNYINNNNYNNDNNNRNRNNTLNNNNYRNNNYNRNTMNINNDNNNNYNIRNSFDNRYGQNNNRNNNNDFNRNNNNNYNRNNTFNYNNNNSKRFNNDNLDNNINNDINNNDNYNNSNNKRNYNNINNNIYNDNDNDNDNYNDHYNYSKNQNNRNTQNNFNNRNNVNNNSNYNNNNRRKNEFINNNPSKYHSIKTQNNSNSYNKNMFDDDNNNDEQNNIINTNSNNNYYSNNINNNNDDMPPLEKKSSHSHRNNLMQTRISSEEDFKNIFNSLDNNENKEELKKNIFG